MKFHSRFAVVLAVARIAASQYLPACADSCLGFTDTSSSSSSSECNAFDLSCSCTNKAYLDAGVCCLHESCTDSAREEADAYARSLCSSAGYVMPTGIRCSTISAATDAQSTETAGSDGSSTTAGSKADTTADNLATYTNIALPSSDDSGSSSSSDNYYSTKRRKSHTLKTGLGVGLGVGIPLISAVLGYLALLRRKKSRQANMANTQEPPMAAYTAPPPQGYPPPGYPPQNQPPSGYPPQGWHPEGFVVSPPATQTPPSQSSTPLKYEPSSSPDGTTIQHEMIGTTPPPRQELHSDALPNHELHANPQLPNELHSTPQPLNPLNELP
ncbi:hypothetical protein BGZ61DRAFT_458881 [Ilyonectria robusta]|uniref:uncharacterized protein n=1 Tax=Ilyonectria robusta TaxID=1079257 RepID=UPI001E8D8077|nr:uncharacterized protein BGZ61DRAFT_458881 [Ilyonectria robusta]KAH8673141.1 hypothetical protein BGZ61DRAFT_458881 [Ilyonectria robusta]